MGAPHQLLDGTILELIKTLRPEEMANISQMRSSISMANCDAISQKTTAVAKEGIEQTLNYKQICEL